MSHLALRNTKRGKRSANSDKKSSSEILELLKILLAILVNCYTWIRFSFLNTYITYGGSQDIIKESVTKRQHLEGKSSDQTAVVVARGVGLMAAYTGRRAMFAIYPATPEGLDISSQGPAPISFEYKKRDGMFLVGYIPQLPGRYRLRVARFGKKAIGSPFLLSVEDPPAGYNGHFGASLWHERPSPPPVTSGVVDFVKEKMFLTGDGKLVRLNKKGNRLVPVEDKATMSDSLTEDNVIGKPEKDTERRIYKTTQLVKSVSLDEEISQTSLPSELTTKNVHPRTQVISRIEKLLSTINKENVKDPQDKYRHVSKALMKELSFSLKILNMLGSNRECSSASDSPVSLDERRDSVVPEIRITEAETNSERTCDHQSRGNRILSDSGDGVRRAAKLGWHWGDDAVGSEPYDGFAQIRRRREGIIKSLAEEGGAWYKNGIVSSIAAGLMKRKNPELTGIRLLHGIYRNCETEQNVYTNRHINNKNSPKLDYQNVINVHNERNNITIEKNSTNKKYSDGIKKRRNFTSFKPKTSLRKYREGLDKSNCRSLSLPDFNRILAISVQGLRKAKSCGDKSFRTLSSSSISVALKGLFEREQIYNMSNASKTNDKTAKRPNDPTLVRLTHYGSSRDNRSLPEGLKSVEEWTKYWEEIQRQKEEYESGKECSLDLTGIVDRSKSLFETKTTYRDESNRTVVSPQKKYHKNTSLVVQSQYGLGRSSPETYLTPSPGSKKTAFQKAKEIFEGNIILNEVNDEKENRKLDNAVASLGSVYQSHYPHTPIRRIGDVRRQLVASDFILRSNPSYV